MVMNRSLEVRLLHYFLLIAMAAIMIGIEFYFEMDRADLTKQICSLEAAPGEALDHLRNKIVIMFGVLTLVVAIVLMMFIKNITQPLQKMAVVAKRINEGDLSQMVEVEHKDEIGQVGETINDLTSNLQEVAAFTSATGAEILEKLDALSERLEKEGKPVPGEITEVRENLASLHGFVESFKLFN
jgi:methyl-accepting chemotaxis protein